MFVLHRLNSVLATVVLVCYIRGIWKYIKIKKCFFISFLISVASLFTMTFELYIMITWNTNDMCNHWAWLGILVNIIFIYIYLNLTCEKWV